MWNHTRAKANVALKPSLRRAWPAVVLAGWALVLGIVELAVVVDRGLNATFGARANSGVIVFHLAAELGMALLPAVGGFGWWRGRAWGPGVLLIGLGLQVYASLNAAGWAVANDRILLVPMVGMASVAALVAIWLVIHPAAAWARWTWKRSVVLVWFVVGGLQIIVLWTSFFIGGEVSDVFVVRSDVGIVATRDLAEIVMALCGLAGGWGVLRGRSWGTGVALFALGLFGYAALNTTSNAVVISSAWVALQAITGVVVLVLAPHFIARYAEARPRSLN